jgi:hypothetical protein
VLSLLYALTVFPNLCAAAPVEVSFPLEGHYREGRYMPMRVVVGDAGAGAGTVTLAADGALPTELPVTAGRTDVVIPWLAVRELNEPRWSNSAGPSGAIATPLKPLSEDERLVAFATDEPPRAGAVARLFPGKAIVPVRLDASGPLLRPAAAYEALDGLVLDPGAAARVDESQVAVLLAAGTTIAVRSDARPGGAWPWRREGAYWVLRREVLGPRSIVEPDAYQPTYGWPRGWSGAVRARVVLLAALFVILAVGLMLWRPKYVLAALVALSLVTSAGVVAWGARQSPVLAAGGRIAVWDGAIAQQDDWVYRATLRPSEVTIDARGLAHPVLDRPRQAEESRLRLFCTPDGQPARFAADLDADHALAVLTRSVQPTRPATQNLQPVTSPLFVLANQLYPGTVLGQSGETPADPDRNWGAIYLDASTGLPR